MKFGLSTDTINKIHSVFRNHPEVTEIVIYGSRAKGNFRPGSDIDLTMKGESLNDDLKSKILSELDELNTPYIFDLSIYHELHSQEFIEHIERVGKCFYP